MKKQRPINLQLWTISFPVTAIASISHRISGVLLFIISITCMYLLGFSISSESNFEKIKQVMLSLPIRIFVFLMLLCLMTHMSLGLRHLMMEFGMIAKSFKSGCISAYAFFFIAFILAIAMEYYLYV